MLSTCCDEGEIDPPFHPNLVPELLAQRERLTILQRVPSGWGKAGIVSLPASPPTRVLPYTCVLALDLISRCKRIKRREVDWFFRQDPIVNP